MAIATPVFGQKERKREASRRRGTKSERGYGGEWEAISLMKRADHPVCQVCNNAPATQVDHIIPFADQHDPLRTDWNNIQSICQECHTAKTLDDQRKKSRSVDQWVYKAAK